MESAIHIAGPLDQATLTQRCSRCGDTLAVPSIYRPEPWELEIDPTLRRERIDPPRRVFTAGDLVESCRHGLCLVLAVDAVPTCQRKAESREAA